ncbi:MAG TPA: PE-PPE domain-containing protein, partial [Mycobacterium sp.]|nr:PE-PPE domain-containing protein [Mycobacterium sp.]
MAGKHRKHSPFQTEVAKRGGTGLAAAALSVTGLSTAVVTGTTAAVAPNVQLMALVSAANSTSQFFAGSTYYGTDWTTVYGNQQVVPFFQGPQGIANAITNNAYDKDSTGVTGSGWGAGQAGTALGIIAANDAANGTHVLDSVGLVILDNNTNRAGGGFWTTYYPFAPLLFTSAEPTPSNLPVTVLDVAYEYNINSDAPVDPLNPFAIGNSLAAYAFDYGAENRALNITQEEVDGEEEGDEPTTVLVLHQSNGEDVTLEPGRHYVVEDGVVTNGPLDANGNHTGDALPAGTTTTYVTVASENLPLTRPLRLIPGGDILANAVDPVMTDLVNAGYNDGKGLPGDPAIPADPTVTRPMQPFSSLGALNAGDLSDDAQQGATAGATTAFQDVGNPSNF